MLNACYLAYMFLSKHSKCADTYKKIDEAALWDLLLFLSIFNLLGCTLRPRNTLKGGTIYGKQNQSLISDCFRQLLGALDILLHFAKHLVLQAPKCYENHLFAFLPPSFLQTKKVLDFTLITSKFCVLQLTAI